MIWPYLASMAIAAMTVMAFGCAATPQRSQADIPASVNVRLYSYRAPSSQPISPTTLWGLGLDLD